MTSFDEAAYKEKSEEYCNLHTCYEDIIERIRNEIIQNYYNNTYDNDTRIQNLQGIYDAISPEPSDFNKSACLVSPPFPVTSIGRYNRRKWSVVDICLSHY